MTEINNRIEEKIKGIVLSVWSEEISVNKGIEQLCQLFTQPLDAKELREKIEKIVAYQFDLVTNLSQEGYLDSLKMIVDQILALFDNYRK